MTIQEMANLKKGDEVLVQADDDPELEEGMIVRIRPTGCLVYGENPSMPVSRQGFLMWLRAEEIIKLKKTREAVQSTVTITGDNLEVSRG